jgi:tRNA(adenine34) deaminase
MFDETPEIGDGGPPAGSGSEITCPSDRHFMTIALQLASDAGRLGEVPVGAVLVQDGVVIGRGANAPIQCHDPTAHAEILALRQAAAHARNYRLSGSTLYVTLEPCAMCAGALVNSRVKRLVFGARDLRFGAVRSKFRLADSDLLNHRVEIAEGIMGFECARLLQDFFEGKR